MLRDLATLLDDELDVDRSEPTLGQPGQDLDTTVAVVRNFTAPERMIGSAFTSTEGVRTRYFVIASCA